MNDEKWVPLEGTICSLYNPNNLNFEGTVRFLAWTMDSRQILSSAACPAALVLHANGVVQSVKVEAVRFDREDTY